MLTPASAMRRVSLAQLSRNGLPEALDHHFALGHDLDPGRLERAARGGAVREQDVGGPAAAHHPRAAPLDAHAGLPQRLAHRRERAGAILERDGQVPHRQTPSATGSQRTSVVTELAM